MTYTIKALAELSGVSTRTLRYYDAIDLLPPAHVGNNGYRYYDDQSLLRLQQVLFFRELGVKLSLIKTLLDAPDFDRLQALEHHRTELQQRAARLDTLLHTIDQTIYHLKGETTMSDDQLFEGFSEEKQAEYEEQIRAEYGNEKVDQSVRRWGSYSKTKQEALKEEGKTIFRTIRDAMDQGTGSPAVQEQIAALHKHVNNFYDCSLDCLRGLGQMYTESPDFIVTFQKLHPDMPQFLNEAIGIYCDHNA